MNVAILTTFQEFVPGYSLTGIAKDQARMLAKHGNRVFLFVNEKYYGESFSDDVTLVKKIPFTNLTDYQTKDDLSPEHKEIALLTAKMLIATFRELEIDVAYTHDFLFTGWNLPYAAGILAASPDLPDVAWFHWIHSIPTASRDWWVLPEYGPNHKLIYPNATDKMRVAESYRTDAAFVRTIPHIKDMRTFFNFRPETCEIIDLMPALMQADIVQIYPASTDRLVAKRVKEVMSIFGFMKSQGRSVALLVANQWATGRQRKEEMEPYFAHANTCGLEYGKDFVFSSTLKDGIYDKGVPMEILRELMMLSNLFIFPTREETFGLVLPEVSLASGALCVLNKSLQMQLEIGGYNTLFFDFGSYHHAFEHPDPDSYLLAIALVILARMNENEGIVTRTWMRKKYNMDNLYRRYYEPIMAEAKLAL